MTCSRLFLCLPAVLPKTRRHVRPFSLLLPLLFGLLCLPGLLPSAQAQTVTENPAYNAPRGPITLRNMRPYNLLFLQFIPESADTLPTGKNRYGLQLDVANNLLIPSATQGIRVVEDNEIQRLTLSWRRGVAPDTEFGVFVPVLWRNGGFLDSILSAYHRLFGLQGNSSDNPAGRRNEPEFRSLLQLTDSNGNLLVNQGNAFGFGEVSLTIKHSLLRSTPRSALAARLGVKLPTGNPTLLLGSGTIDAGLSFDARYSVGRDFIFYLNLGGALHGRTGRVPNVEPGTFQEMVCVEYRPNHRDSFILQIEGSNPTVRTGNRFADRAQVTATFGYKRVLDRHLVWSAAFSENGDIHNYSLPAFSNIGPDFTVSTGLEWHP